MKKILSIVVALMLCILTALSIVACGGGSGDIIIDEGGNIRPSGGKTVVTMWGANSEKGLESVNQLVSEFNKEYEGIIEVRYYQKHGNGYAEAVRLALQQTNGPDVVYVDDKSYKSLAELNLISPLDSYLDESDAFDYNDIWDSAFSRYRYDLETTTSDGANAQTWAVPKDMSPTVIYYNETLFNQAGITVISVDAEDLSDFNNGSVDLTGKSKSDYGITGEVKQKGYFIDDSGKIFFNNRIPMSWEETVACSLRVQENSSADYGFFTEWWFNYGWSVGGDCIEYVETDDDRYTGGYWDFTLMDNTPNYIVADGYVGAVKINGTDYHAGEIIAWQDKLVDPAADEKQIRSEIAALVEEGTLNELPSQRDAFVEFVRMGQADTKTVDVVNGEILKGYGISPTPSSIGGDSGKTIAFKDGLIAMLVDDAYVIADLREQMEGYYEWGVAPLPQYKEYDSAGNITVHGIEAGHSEANGLVLNAKSNVPQASWIVMEYFAGERGQIIQAENGVCVPLQKSVANSNAFLQTDINPKNIDIFLKMAEIQTPGDWWYLYDNEWIDDWSGRLNGDVRNARMTLSEFENCQEYKGTWDKLKEYTLKNS